MSNSQTEWWAPVERNGDSADLFGGDPESSQQPRRSRSGGRQRQERQRKQRRRRSFVVVIVALALVVGAGYVVVSLVGNMFGGSDTANEKTTDFPGPGFGEATVTINTGDTGADMGATLTEAGVVASPEVFAEAFAANADASSIQPGTYKLLQEMPASAAVDALLNPASKDDFRITIAEGLTKAQILEKISAKTLIPLKDLQAAAKDAKAIGLPAQAGGNAEGWLFPATYDLAPDASAEDVLSKMTAKTVDVLKANKVAKADWESVLNEASLIEREGKLDEDRPKMARVIDNRIKQGWPLGIDASVAYGLNKNGTELTRADTQDKSNEYNLYTHAGLPPTPIASPGEESIKAVLNPADGTWMFWCTVDPSTGETVFSNTQAEQDAAQAKLQAWVKAHGKG